MSESRGGRFLTTGGIAKDKGMAVYVKDIYDQRHKLYKHSFTRLPRTVLALVHPEVELTREGHFHKPSVVQ